MLSVLGWEKAATEFGRTGRGESGGAVDESVGIGSDKSEGVGPVGKVGGVSRFVVEASELEEFFLGCAGDSGGNSGFGAVGRCLESLVSGLGSGLLTGRWEVSRFAVALDAW